MEVEAAAAEEDWRLLSLPEDCCGLRLDQALARLLPEHSRSRLQNWIRDGRVLVDGAASDPKRKLRGGETLVVLEEEPPPVVGVEPEDMALDILFEDDALLVIAKPAGLVVHPGSGNWSGTLMNGLLFRYPGLAGVPRAGIVHRLDKDTSGLMVVARSLPAQTDLVRQMQARTVKRQYLALAWGEVARDGLVDAPMARHPTQRTKMAVVPGGKAARTHYKVLERFPGLTLVECSLETGRTHQIRVHMASIKHPLVGDPVYGPRHPPLAAPAVARTFPRQALHAFRLGLTHPVSGEAMSWEMALPEDFQELLRALREGGG
ncbi:MAG: 23S rRNA pseudouridine(1911/1915/1917) synthase RluD [Rhodocyclaceae bacterium]|nr:23S rRNA pseudouridine(1911/1915/1917) synthase RluD [Rhodocyclaceae bacterium]